MLQFIARFSSVDNPVDVDGIAVEMISENPFSNNHSEEDITGCNPPFRRNYPNVENWIAVIKRGHCSYSQKIQNAAKVSQPFEHNIKQSPEWQITVEGAQLDQVSMGAPF